MGCVVCWLFRNHTVEWNEICKNKYFLCVPGVDEKVHPSCFMQQDLTSVVTAYAALRPRYGFLYPHQEHMKDTHIPVHIPAYRGGAWLVMSAFCTSFKICPSVLCLSVLKFRRDFFFISSFQFFFTVMS